MKEGRKGRMVEEGTWKELGPRKILRMDYIKRMT
jgi:hypothetical protein